MTIIRREHSRKPEEFYTLVEETCPGGRVELLSRQQRKGWKAYGNNTGLFDSGDSDDVEVETGAE